MIERGDIFPTEGMQFGVSKKHGPWAMLKCLGDKPGSIVSLFVKNPIEIKDADAFKIVNILAVDPRQRAYKGHWVQIVNVTVEAEAVEFRFDRKRGAVTTPEDEVKKYLGM